MQAKTHFADYVPNCARAVELVVAGPCLVAQRWFGSFFGRPVAMKKRGELAKWLCNRWR